MSQANIKFGNQQSTGLSALGGAPGVALNVIVEPSGVVRRRPGIESIPGQYAGVVDATGISGVRGTVGGATYAVGSTPQFRGIYALAGGGFSVLGSGTADTTLAGVARPVFAETQLLMAIAGGDKMQKILLSSNASSRILDNPPYASHVVANSSRLLGNIAAVSATNDFDRSVVRFSNIANGNSSYAGLEQWTEGLGDAGHFSAEANPDPVVAIYENTNEVFCFGTTSLQIFSPDASSVFAPTVTRELGCAAAYSVIKADQQFAWLDQYRRFVLSDGRSQDVLSDPIKRTLDDMGTVSDCFGYRVMLGPVDAFVWTFPTDGRTFAFQKGSGWAEWQGWDDSTSNLSAFSVMSHHQVPTTHDSVAGTAGGYVGRLSLEASTDLGARIVARVDSGYEDHGTDERKACRVVRVAVKRGELRDGDTPQAFLRYRDAPGPWGAPLPIDLGATGDTRIVVEFRSLGVYRRRQWQFEFSGTEALELVAVTEDFQVLST